MRRSLGKMSKRSRALGQAARKLTVMGLISSFSVGQHRGDRPPVKIQRHAAPRYRGRTGTITAKRGKAYVVRIRDGRRSRT